jgi:NAD(P)H-flavin reductase
VTEAAKPSTSFAAATVLDAWDETDQLRALTLDLSVHGAHLPGQAVKLRTGDRRESFFALANAAHPDGRVELLIKRGPDVANLLIGAAARGATIEASPPLGRGFPVAEAIGRDVLLFAAGSGISPVRSLLQHLIMRRGELGQIALYYGQRRPEEFAYRREHEAWTRAGVKVALCLSGDAAGWSGLRGHVQVVAASRGFDGAIAKDSVAFVCGMKGMVEGVRQAVGAAGVPADRVFLNF